MSGFWTKQVIFERDLVVMSVIMTSLVSLTHSTTCSKTCSGHPLRVPGISSSERCLSQRTSTRGQA
eukprot:4936413-Heterocapsa_arctica.AAC.1